MRHVEAPGDVATKLGEGLYVAAAPPPTQVPPVKASVEEVLAAYSHRTKPENPVYTTSSNAIGYKRPDLSTYNNDRLSVPQAFSKSFNNILVSYGPPYLAHCTLHTQCFSSAVTLLLSPCNVFSTVT